MLYVLFDEVYNVWYVVFANLLNLIYIKCSFFGDFFRKIIVRFVDKNTKIVYNKFKVNNIYVTDGFAEYRVGI